jgi:hypothetical protein
MKPRTLLGVRQQMLHLAFCAKALAVCRLACILRLDYCIESNKDCKQNKATDH